MTSIGSALKDLTQKKPWPNLPDHFVCESAHCDCGCVGICEEAAAEFIEWCRKYKVPSAVSYSRLACVKVRTKKAAEERAAQNLRDANFPIRDDKTGPRTFENYTVTEDTEDMFKAARGFSEGKGPRILVLTGDTGVGKTHLMEAAGRVIASNGRSVRYENVTELLNRLRHSYSDADGEDMYELVVWYGGRAVLLLDEVGLSTTEWGVDNLTRLVDRRMADGMWLMVATNLVTKPELARRWGARLASRLFLEGTVVRTAAPDYRGTCDYHRLQGLPAVPRR